LYWNQFLVSDDNLTEYLTSITQWFDKRPVYEKQELQIIGISPICSVNEIDLPNYGHVLLQKDFDSISAFDIIGALPNQIQKVEFGLFIPLEFYETDIPMFFVPLLEVQRNCEDGNVFTLDKLIANTRNRTIQFGLNIIFSKDVNVSEQNYKVQIEYFNHSFKVIQNEPKPKFITVERPYPGVTSFSLVFRYHNSIIYNHETTFTTLTKNTPEFQTIKTHIQSFVDKYQFDDDLRKLWLQKLNNDELLEQSLKDIVDHFQNKQEHQKELELTDWFYRNSFDTLSSNIQERNLVFAEDALGPVKIETSAPIDHVLFGVYVPFFYDSFTSHSTYDLQSTQFDLIANKVVAEDFFVPIVKSFPNVVRVENNKQWYSNFDYEYEFTILPEQEFITKQNCYMGMKIVFENQNASSQCKINLKHFIAGPKTQKLLKLIK
jgi:hypothetical protein